MQLKRVERFIPIAREIAKAEFYNWWDFRHVSIIISNKSIVSVGTNAKKTHTFCRKNRYLYDYLHSEADAYSKIRYMNCGNLVLLNFRFNKSGELRMSKPCKYCMPFCLSIFDEIWYSTDDGMVRL